MSQLLKKLFKKKDKKVVETKVEASLVVPNPKNQNGISNVQIVSNLSLSKFIENNQDILMSIRTIRSWYIQESLIIERLNDYDNENTYIATNKGKQFGIKTANYYYKGNPRTGIFISDNAQIATLSHFASRDKKLRTEIIVPKNQINEDLTEDLSIDHPYFDTILSDLDKNIKLDNEQRIAVINNSDNLLIVAGAGAGKTTTMAAKVKYLIEKKGVKPEEIILISYTNKAIFELRDKINKKLGILVNISTFHAFAFDIVKKTKDTAPKILYSSYTYINEYLEQVIFKDQTLLRKLVLFLGYYFDLNEDVFKYNTLDDYIEAKSTQDYETLKSSLGDYVKSVSNQRERYQKTIKGEYLRSAQEVQLANFFYLNSIDYEYEKIYPITIHKTKKPYTPDFYIKQGELEAYLEHFGLTENHFHSLYTPFQIDKYVKGIEFKRNVHKINHTLLLETYSEYNDGRSLMEHVAEVLQANGFILKPRDPNEIYKKIVETGKDKYVIKFIFFMMDFIELYKSRGFGRDGFSMLREKTKNVRSLMFLDIAEGAFTYYQEKLENINEIDFSDMINQASEFLNSPGAEELKLPYKYIIIDEFQDIAKQRFDFAKILAKRTDAKITAVGDDWQSIFAFAGSDISLFTKFIELIGSGDQMKITHTYRNSQELIDIAGGFIQKNSNQIKKTLISPKKLSEPIRIVEFDDSFKKMKSLSDRTLEIIDEILKVNPKADILMLGRYGFDLRNLAFAGEFTEIAPSVVKSKTFPQARLTFLTVHSSKGLGYDEVIVLNMVDDRFGFPSQIENDPIMKLVTIEDRGINFSEERRLFYVALTRTKNHVYLMTPMNKPSRFILELVKDYNLKHTEKLKLELSDKFRYKCPECGSPLKYSANNSFGLFLYICTNEPELCNFMTNEPNAMQDIFKCDKCSNGYMITKKGKEENTYFIGCTNYRNPEIKCTNILNVDKTKFKKKQGCV